MSENVCAMCGKTFESRSKLTQHSIQTHEEKKCDECGNMFKKANFARHLKVHTGRSVLTCEECGKTFNRTDGFRKHVNRFHEETAEHECGDCKKTFSQKWYLKEHMIIHTGAPRKQCKYCEKDFSSKSHLHRHVKKCHPTPKILVNTQGFIIPITTMLTSQQRSTERLFWQVLSISIVTTSSFNPVVSIKNNVSLCCHYVLSRISLSLSQ